MYGLVNGISTNRFNKTNNNFFNNINKTNRAKSLSNRIMFSNGEVQGHRKKKIYYQKNLLI